MTSVDHRVLFAVSYFPPYAPGGAEWSAERLVGALQERGVPVHVAGPRLRSERHPTIPVDLIPCGLRLPAGRALLRARSFMRPDVQLRLAFGFLGAARRSGSTIIHCHQQAVLPAAALAARLARVPLVVTVRDLSAVCPLTSCLLERTRVPSDCGVRRLQRRCVQEYCGAYGTPVLRTRVSSLVGFAVSRFRALLLRGAAARIFISSDLADLHTDAGLVDREASIDVIGNIADAIPTGPAPGTAAVQPFALYAGRLSVGKGIGVLLDAVPRVRSVHPEFKLVCVGGGDDTWRGRLGATDGVEYRGAVPHADLLETYRSARLAVVPSIWPEPLGRSVLEAQAAGVPVVAARSGGIVDAITDSEDGLLVPARDPDALAGALARLWGDGALRATLAANARVSVQRRFSAGTVSARTIAAYDRAVLTHRGKRGSR